MNDIDLHLFQFDFDLTWYTFFVSPEERIYGRYGGRDPKSCDGRLSVAGFKYTMKLILDEHKRSKKEDPSPAPVTFRREPFQTERRGCMHCHQVWEGLRHEERAKGTFDPKSFYVYPIPENVGLTLSVDEGNKVTAVKAKSPAAKAGIQAGDILEKVHQTKTFSQGDVMAALHHSPMDVTISVKYRRDGQSDTVDLDLPTDWKKTDLSWRPSMLKEKIPK